MKEGCFLRFIPPLLSGGDIGNKNRYMLVVEYNSRENNIKMINVSSLKGKEHKLLFSSNIEINNYSPLPVPSFAKLDTLYSIDYFRDIEKYIAFNGNILSDIPFEYLNNYRIKYMQSNEIEIIQFTENEFKKYNK